MPKSHHLAAIVLAAVVFTLIYVHCWAPDPYTYTVHATVPDNNIFSIVEWGKDSVEFIRFSREGKEIQIAESESASFKGDFVPVYVNVYKTAEIGFDTVEIKFATQSKPLDVFVSVDQSLKLLQEWIHDHGDVRIDFEPVMVKKTDQIVKFVVEG